MNVRLIANSQAGIDHSITPASASSNSSFTPPDCVPRSMNPHLLRNGRTPKLSGLASIAEVLVELGHDHRDLGRVEVEPQRRADEAAEQPLDEVDPPRLDPSPAPRRLESVGQQVDPGISRRRPNPKPEPDAGRRSTARSIPSASPSPRARPTTAPRA